MKNKERVAVLAELFESSRVKTGTGNQPPESFIVLKYGPNRYSSGGRDGSFDLTEESADRIIEDFRRKGRDIVIDYEHQTLSGEAAPAAGWINGLEKAPEGLAARVKYWTEKAASYLRSGEYRYFSPVLIFSGETGEPESLHSVAVTNHPALHGLEALAASDTTPETKSNTTTTQKEMFPMKETLGALGLDTHATVSLSQGGAANPDLDKIMAGEVRKLTALRDETNAVLKLHNCATVKELAALASPALKQERDHLDAELKKRDAKDAVARVFSERKLCESLRQWAMEFAERAPEAFAEWAKNAPVTVPDNSGIEQRENPAEFSGQYSDEQLKIFRRLGVNIEKLKNRKNK